MRSSTAAFKALSCVVPGRSIENLVYRRMKNFAEKTCQQASRCLPSANIRLPSNTYQALRYCLQISLAVMQHHVSMTPVRSATLQNSVRILLSSTHHFKTYSVALSTSHSPAAPPGWPHRPSVSTYVPPMYTYNRKNVLQKSL